MLGHLIMGMNLSMPSMIGILGLAGVVINDSIIMLSFIDKSKNTEDFFNRSILRFRPIMLTSITTLIGLSTLIFFATGQSLILQPIAISLGFGLAWGTIVNLFYVPALYAVLKGYKD
jgi:multidrug efflux pump subunit AcrB